MAHIQHFAERRTSADDVYDHLHSQIVTLKLLPGTKMSEVEIAGQFELSRQPVREAFIRLGNLGLLRIRPQKATFVRKFSTVEISNARFIRTAIKVEILTRPCAVANDEHHLLIEKNLTQQKQAIKTKDADKFHALDYEFHRLLCVAADCEFAFQSIADNKAQVHRLCMLSLADQDEMAVLWENHYEILNALKARDVERMIAAIRAHLGRLDATAEVISSEHQNYFED